MGSNGTPWVSRYSVTRVITPTPFRPGESSITRLRPRGPWRLPARPGGPTGVQTSSPVPARHSYRGSQHPSDRRPEGSHEGARNLPFAPGLRQNKLWNEDARPFTWTKTPDQIIDRICRYCSRIPEPAH